MMVFVLGSMVVERALTPSKSNFKILGVVLRSLALVQDKSIKKQQSWDKYLIIGNIDKSCTLCKNEKKNFIPTGNKKFFLIFLLKPQKYTAYLFKRYRSVTKTYYTQ